MLRTIRTHWAAPYVAVLLSLTTTAMCCSPASAGLPALRKFKPVAINWNRALPSGMREALTPEVLRMALNRSTHPAKQPNIRPLTAAEMKSYRGRGPLRNQYFCGALPWQRSLRDVNLCTGNLFKSFTDIQVSPAHGAGLALQRTYNSDDDRVGPFGTGWTHAYDMRMQESATPNLSDRVDFFGARHSYHRDADGLYSPPAYLFDELNSNYNSFLVNGPTSVTDDTDVGMDGTIKHYIADDNSRVCDYIQDRFGNRTTLAYNLTITMPDSTQQNVLTSVTDPSGRQLIFSWTNLNTAQQPIWRITQVTGPQYSVTYLYGSDSNLSRVTLDPGGVNRITNYTYSTYGTETGLLASITDPLGHSVSYAYTNPTGNPTGTLWVTTVTEPGSGGNHVWTILPTGWTQVPDFLTYVNDNDTAHTISFSTLTDNYLRCKSTEIGTIPLYQTTYDTSNNVVQTRQPANGVYTYNSNIHLADCGMVATYGPHGNVLTQYPLGFSNQVTTTTYYNASQYFQKASVTDPLGHVTTFGVGTNTDSNIGNRGNVLTVQDARYGITGAQFTYAYNSYGQKTSETNENGIVTNYTYGDQWGNLTGIVQDPGGTGHLNRATSMSYDVAGHVLTSVDNNNQTDSFVYNTLGQPVSASFPATAGAPAETISYAYDGNGRTHSVTDNRGQTTMNYETGNDRVSSVADPVTGTTTYSYGLAGQRTSMGLPGGGTWNYAYVTGGGSSGTGEVHPKDQPDAVAPRLVSVTDDQNRLVNYQMDLRGVTHEIYSNQVFNGQGTLQSYNWTGITEDTGTGGTTHGWTAQIQNQYWWNTGQYFASKNLTQNVYSYDNNGMRLTNQVTIGNNAARTETYGYDELERLTSVNYGDGQTQSYAFDPMANRTQKVDSVTGTENSAYNAANMILTRGASNNYTYDNNGNTLTGGGRTNTWDSENRMVKSISGANTSFYTYAADGLRHRSVVNSNTTDYAYDADMFVREISGGTNLATYLAGPIGPMYRRDDVLGTVKWYCYDALGSVLAEVDNTGTITASRAFDVYGSVRNSTGTSTSKHKFVGQLGHTSDDETGLIYMRARYMDPVAGTFLSQDPGHHGGNWYGYCNADPTNLADPDGRNPTPWQLICSKIAAAFAILGGVFAGLASAEGLATMGLAAFAAVVEAGLVAFGAAEAAVAVAAMAIAMAPFAVILLVVLAAVCAVIAGIVAFMATFDSEQDFLDQNTAPDPSGGSPLQQAYGIAPRSEYLTGCGLFGSQGHPACGSWAAGNGNPGSPCVAAELGCAA